MNEGVIRLRVQTGFERRGSQVFVIVDINGERSAEYGPFATDEEAEARARVLAALIRKETGHRA